MDPQFILQVVFLSFAHFTAGIHASEYLGCYEDNPRRIFPDHNTIFQDNSPSKCITYCFKKGFLLAGVEVEVKCFCGNIVPSTKIPEESCDMPCPGDPTVKCGSLWNINIYRTGPTPSTVSPTSTVAKTSTVASTSTVRSTSTVPSTSTAATTSTVSTTSTTLSPQEALCRGIMEWKYLDVVLPNGNTCQYRCINNSSKKGVSIFKMDGELCNKGHGICIKGDCRETIPISGCPSGFYGVQNMCRMFCYSFQRYPGMSVVINIREGEVCIDEHEDHGICASGKCAIILPGLNL